MRVKGCSMPPAAALMIAMLSLSGCATESSDNAPCPPVVEYSTAEQTRAAAEVEALPESAVLVRMMSDYAVLRDQARSCR